MQRHVQVEDYGYKCQASVLLNVLFFAVSRISSIFAAARNLADAPTQQTVFNALVATLPEYHVLEKRLNAALVDDLPKALRRRSQTMAIDLTLIPYHGQPYRDPEEIYRSEPKSGTSHFHAYATCYVVRKGHRFTIALTPVRRGEKMDKVVQRLLRQARAQGVKCRLLLLDRGFYSVAVIRYLQSARCPFLMPVVRRGRKPKEGQACHRHASPRCPEEEWLGHAHIEDNQSHEVRENGHRANLCCPAATSLASGAGTAGGPLSMRFGVFDRAAPTGSEKRIEHASRSKPPTAR